jgi:hypothetical protein
MNRGRAGEERGGKEMDRCPLTMLHFHPVAQITGLDIDTNVTGHMGPPIIAGYEL